jgi:hypothetical protein
MVQLLEPAQPVRRDQRDDDDAPDPDHAVRPVALEVYALLQHGRLAREAGGSGRREWRRDGRAQEDVD